MFEAKTAMTTKVVATTRETEIYDAIRTMVRNNITGLPVVTDKGSVTGIITEKDVLKLLYDPEDDTGTVGDFMTKGVVSFTEDDSLIDITECLIKNSFRRHLVTAALTRYCQDMPEHRHRRSGPTKSLSGAPDKATTEQVLTKSGKIGYGYLHRIQDLMSQPHGRRQRNERDY
jgi:CBS domain-containing protein